MFHREGYKIIAITLMITAGVVVISDTYVPNRTIFYGIVALVVVLLLLILQFFRNPDRIAPSDSSKIVSPVDGKVVVIEEVFEPVSYTHLTLPTNREV